MGKRKKMEKCNKDVFLKKRPGGEASFYCFAFSISRVRNENTEEQRSQHLMTVAFGIIGDRTIGEENVTHF